MIHALLGAAWLAASGMAGERTVTVLDEESRGLADARVEVVLTPLDDPRLNSAITRHGATTADGIFRFEADDRLVLTRVRCRRPGHDDADVDHRHGLGRPGLSSRLTLTLPRSQERIPLNYREVRLTGLPSGQWIGFDAAVADAVAPWGKGHYVDFHFLIESRQEGWTESVETLTELRRTAEGTRMDDQEWIRVYGRFRGKLRLSFARKGDGLVETPAFWPYCQSKMPILAPTEGYAGEKTFDFDTLKDADPLLGFTGYYLRIRSQAGGGHPTSAHFAKIHGRIETGPGRLAFRFYFNPRAGDRRLAFAPGRNLLSPGPAEPAHLFETQQP